MTREEIEKYASRLTALANTRLLFNTMAELEEFLGNRAIHSNGIRRCYSAPALLRATYRDCAAEVEAITDDCIGLDWLMANYERAWSFYKANFARRKDPEAIARRVLHCHYGPIAGNPLSPKDSALAQSMKDAKVEVELLLLLLLKALPGYNSKSGDVTDIDAQFDRVLRFLREFTAGCGLFDVLPVIKLAEEETLRTRLTLVSHTVKILGTYESFLNGIQIDRTNKALKENAADLDLDGIWEEEDGDAFWEIEAAINPGTYFATRYTRESPRLYSLATYTLQIFTPDGYRLDAYLLHPAAIKRRLRGLPYSDRDNAWYIGDHPDTTTPDSLSFVRTMQSDHWPYRIGLRRVTDAEAIDRYRLKIETQANIDPFKDCRYTFYPSIYAITQEAAYIFDEREDCFYRLPRGTEHQFETLTLDDSVGILEIGPADRPRRYLAIDERLLYIPLTPAALHPYSITPTHSLP